MNIQPFFKDLTLVQFEIYSTTSITFLAGLVCSHIYYSDLYFQSRYRFNCYNEKQTHFYDYLIPVSIFCSTAIKR